MFSNTISVRDLQRGSKALIERANRGEPVVVIRRSKPVGAFIGVAQLEKLQMETIKNEAIREYKEGKTTNIDTKEDLEKYLKESEDETVKHATT